MVKKLNKRNERISPEMIAVIATISILLGGFFLSYNYIQSKKVVAFDYIANVFYNENQEIIVQDGEQQEEEEEELGEVTNDYIGYLSIPKINLKKGFLDKRSPENDVEKNILVVENNLISITDKRISSYAEPVYYLFSKTTNFGKK